MLASGCRNRAYNDQRDVLHGHAQQVLLGYPHRELSCTSKADGKAGPVVGCLSILTSLQSAYKVSISNLCARPPNINLVAFVVVGAKVEEEETSASKLFIFLIDNRTGL